MQVSSTEVMASSVPDWLPPLQGRRHDFTSGAAMPLVPIGGIHLCSSALWLPTHHHRHWELHYVHRGRLVVELPAATESGGATLVVPGGWFCLTPPGRVHRGLDGILPPSQLLWMQVAPGRPRAREGTPFTSADLSRLRRLLAQRADQAWPAPPAMSEVFTRLGDLLATGARDQDAAAVRSALAQVLILAGRPGPIAAHPPALIQACAALAKHPMRPCTVISAARQAGLSPARLHELCVRHLGCTPAAWQLDQRLAFARRRLAEGQPVAQVAAELGFSSPRYFAHAFRREVGVKPSGYADLSRRALAEPCLDW